MRKQFANFVEFSVDEMHHISQQFKERIFFISFYCTTSLITDSKYTYVTY